MSADEIEWGKHQRIVTGVCLLQVQVVLRAYDDASPTGFTENKTGDGCLTGVNNRFFGDRKVVNGTLWCPSCRSVATPKNA